MNYKQNLMKFFPIVSFLSVTMLFLFLMVACTGTNTEEQQQASVESPPEETTSANEQKSMTLESCIATRCEPDKISKPARYAGCKGSCYRDSAKGNEPAFCTQILDLKAEMITDSDDILATRGPELERHYDLCISKIATEKKDAQICKKIAEKTKFYSSFTLCVEDIALAEKNQQICEVIKEIESEFGGVSQTDILYNDCVNTVRS